MREIDDLRLPVDVAHWSRVSKMRTIDFCACLHGMEPGEGAERDAKVRRTDALFMFDKNAKINTRHLIVEADRLDITVPDDLRKVWGKLFPGAAQQQSPHPQDIKNMDKRARGTALAIIKRLMALRYGEEWHHNSDATLKALNELLDEKAPGAVMLGEKQLKVWLTEAWTYDGRQVRK